MKSACGPKACNNLIIIACAVALCMINVLSGLDPRCWKVRENEMTFETNNFVPTGEAAVKGEIENLDATELDQETWGEIAVKIARKWNLSCIDCLDQLKRLALNISLDYSPERDIIVFYHPLKTGGTSLSTLLKGTMGGVIPGSHASGRFEEKIFQEKIQEEIGKDGINDTAALANWWRSKRVIYSHSLFRKYGEGTNQSKLGKLLTTWLPTGSPPQRFRMVTMVRDPVELRASNFHEWMCAVGRSLDLSEQYIEELDLPRNKKSACKGLSMEHISRIRLREFERQCSAEAETNGRNAQICESFMNSAIDPKPFCASISSLLNSDKYWAFLHDMTRHFTVAPNNFTESADFEQAALEHLSGQDTDNGEMIWFGITERMEESMCLFHYQFHIPPLRTPKARYKECRPTSFWSDAEKQVVRERETLDYAVFRAANAILDIRLAKMRNEMQSRLANNETLDYVSPNCVDRILYPNSPTLP